MLTRSKQRLIQNSENINKENNVNNLKRKRTMNAKAKGNKENILPSSIKYSLRSQSKLKNTVLALKSKNESNIINRERGILKDKFLNNNVTNNVKKQIKNNILKENITTNKVLNESLKDKKNKNDITTKRNDKINENDGSKDSKMVVLIEGYRLRNKVINKIQIEEENGTTSNVKPKTKKIKISKVKDEKLLLKNKKENEKIYDSSNTKIENKIKNEKNDQKNSIMKSSITNKNNNKKNNSIIPNEKKKITFDDNVQHIDNSIIISDRSSSSVNDYSDNIKNNDNSSILKNDNSISPIKKESNEIIVPFIKLDSESSSFISTSSNNSINSGNEINKLEKKTSGLSDKSLELLTDFTKGGGKVQLSDLLESLNYKGHLKSSTPNNFNKTLLFLEESPINYTRILNEEMNFHASINENTKYPEKEVSNLSSQNTSFQDSNSLSNFINISPISNSNLHPTDSEFEHIHSGELIDESDLFNIDDKSSIYSMDELDEKIKKLLSGNDNINLFTNNENKSILKYTPISPESLNKKRKINKNDKKLVSLKSNEVSTHRGHFSLPQYSKLGVEAPVVEEITYDDPDNTSYLISQDSSSEDPFGFSKAEKIYKTKQQQLKNNGLHTPIVSNKPHYNKKKESNSLDSVNEILLQEHQQVLEAKKNRNKKKIKVEDMENLNSDDLEEIKQAKDQQMKYFKEIDDYKLNETVL